MDTRDWLADRFEEHRAHLRAVAYRMLGSLSDAEDAVQETWLRLSRSDTGEVENLAGLVAVLDPDVVLSADGTMVRMGSQAQARGADAVAGFSCGRARAARLTLIDGLPGAAWFQQGQPRAVFSFTIAGGRITAIEMLADQGVLDGLDVVVLKNE